MYTKKDPREYAFCEMDTFTLPLPKIKASGSYVSAEIAAARSPELLHRYRNPLLTFRQGGYFDIELVIGKLLFKFNFLLARF